MGVLCELTGPLLEPKMLFADPGFIDFMEKKKGRT